MSRIKLYYHSGSKNHGCEAIVRGTSKILQEDLSLFSIRPNEDIKYGLNDICEIIDDKVNGYLIKDRSKKDMANAILELIDNLELRRSMGEKGRDNACKYSKENISAMWFDFLESLLNK